MRPRFASPLLVAVFALGALMLAAAVRPQAKGDDPLVARGKYLVAFGACNDCHTPGWRERDGKVPVADWMTGSSTGFRGPWGTAYPANARLEFQQISEQQWLDMVRTRGGHPPMTWTNLRVLSLADQRAIYRFIHSLGAAGQPAPDGLPPGKDPTTPYFEVTPVHQH